MRSAAVLASSDAQRSHRRFAKAGDAFEFGEAFGVRTLRVAFGLPQAFGETSRAQTVRRCKGPCGRRNDSDAQRSHSRRFAKAGDAFELGEAFGLRSFASLSVYPRRSRLAMHKPEAISTHSA